MGVPGRLLRLDGRRPRDVAGAAPRVARRGPDRLRAAGGLDLLLEPRDPVRRRGPGRDRHRPALAIAESTSSPCRSSLYALWWLGWGHEASRTTSLENLADAPLYVFDSIASAISSLLGLATPRDESAVGAYDWGRVLAVAAIGLAGWRLVRLGSVPRWLWVVAAIAFSFWLLSAFNQIPDRRAELEPVPVRRRDLRDPDRGRAPARRPAAAGGARGRRGGRAAGRAQRDLVSEPVGEVLRRDQRPDRRRPGGARDRPRHGPARVRAQEEIAGTGYVHVTADDYLSGRRRLRLSGRHARRSWRRRRSWRGWPPTGCSAAALGLAVLPAGKPGSGCARTALDTGPVEVELPPGGAVVEGTPGSTADLRLARFATENHPIGAGEVAGDERTLIFIPPDRSPVPWRLLATGGGSIDICFGDRPVISTPAMAIVPTPAPTSGDGEPRCAWCEAPIDPAAPHPERRVPCARCGAQTTWPVPTDAELEAAYGAWYRPGAGRFSGLGDRAAAAAPRPPRRPRRLDRPARAGARRRRGRRGAARRARGDRAGRGRPRAPFRAPRRARGRARGLRRARARRSSSGTRSSTCATRARRSTTPHRCSSPAAWW